MIARSLALATVAAMAVAGPALARDHIWVVGSSTIYPFATRVAEAFGRTSRFGTPVIESTGTGGGFKLFCEGVGIDTPDICDASRPIEPSELESCAGAQVAGVTAVKIGFDGIVLANSRAAPRMNITLEQLYLALAKDVPDGTRGPDEEGGTIPNPYRRWSEISPSLPDVEIRVFGPPPTSGTRDAFAALAMERGCDAIPGVTRLATTDAERHKALCRAMREDGAYVEAGENDVLIVRKLEADEDAFGIFGYGFLAQNADRLQGSLIDGIADDHDEIASGRYPISRALYLYVKRAHVGVVPGIREYLDAFTGEEAWGPDGYLTHEGLVALSDAERARWREVAESMPDNTER